jgi:hypothetical protein
VDLDKNLRCKAVFEITHLGMQLLLAQVGWRSNASYFDFRRRIPESSLSMRSIL